MFGLLIQYGSNYNLQDESGYTSLHLSSVFNNYYGCYLLVNLQKINFLVLKYFVFSNLFCIFTSNFYIKVRR